MIDHEIVFRLIYERRWDELLRVLHYHHKVVRSDPLLTGAVETFLTAFFDHLDQGEDPASYADVLEKLFLFHTGDFYRLRDEHFRRVIETLVALHAGHPDVAAGYARFHPDRDGRDGDLVNDGIGPVPITEEFSESALHLATTEPDGQDATISLFKSQQEIDFFMAVREVFATYFVYPNVALSCLVDYEQIRDRLSPEARSYFFRALIDCVVFDQHDGYRPRFFFELDSHLHDDPEQRARDRLKDQILSKAGQRLLRIRRLTPGEGRAAFIALLKEVAARELD